MPPSWIPHWLVICETTSQIEFTCTFTGDSPGSPQSRSSPAQPRCILTCRARTTRSRRRGSSGPWPAATPLLAPGLAPTAPRCQTPGDTQGQLPQPGTGDRTHHRAQPGSPSPHPSLGSQNPGAWESLGSAGKLRDHPGRGSH